MTTLQLLDLSDNALEGIIPASFWRGPRLHSLYLDSPGPPFRLQGSLPEQIADPALGIPNLRHLALNRQALTGTVPAGFGRLNCTTIHTSPTASACIFWMEGNDLDGALPATLCDREYNEVYLSGNKLECPVPCFKAAYKALDPCPQSCIKCPSSPVP